MLVFTEEHKIFRETVKSFVDKELRPNIAKWELEGETPKHIWKKCGDMGFFGINYPKKYGGMEADYTYTLIYFEELS